MDDRQIAQDGAGGVAACPVCGMPRSGLCDRLEAFGGVCLPTQPEVVWVTEEHGFGGLYVYATHEGPHVFIDGHCSCGVLDLGIVRGPGPVADALTELAKSAEAYRHWPRLQTAAEIVASGGFCPPTCEPMTVHYEAPGDYQTPDGFLYLDGGTLDLGIIREGAPWWRPIKRRRLRRQARDDAAMFVESWQAEQ